MTLKPDPITLDKIDALAVKHQRGIRIAGRVVALIFIIIILFIGLIEFLQGNPIVRGLLLFILTIAIGFAYYRPTVNPVFKPTNPTTNTDNKIPDEPSLTFTHPAVMLLGIYMVTFAMICLGLVIQIGTEVTPKEIAAASDQPTANSTATPSETDQTTTTNTDTAEPGKTSDTSTENLSVQFLTWNIQMTAESRLLLLIVLSGALGGLLKGLQSYRWYLGERNFKASWISYYISEPFVGGTLALLFYVLIRGGFFNAQALDTDSTNRFGLVATSGLIGLFNSQAMKKLKQLAETIFTSNIGENPINEDQAKLERQKAIADAAAKTVADATNTTTVGGTENG